VLRLRDSEHAIRKSDRFVSRLHQIDSYQNLLEDWAIRFTSKCTQLNALLKISSQEGSLENLSNFSRRIESHLKFIKDSNIESVTGFLGLLLPNIFWSMIRHPFRFYKLSRFWTNWKKTKTVWARSSASLSEHWCLDCVDDVQTIAATSVLPPTASRPHRLHSAASSAYKRGTPPWSPPFLPPPPTSLLLNHTLLTVAELPWAATPVPLRPPNTAQSSALTP
jgi:hypothetical protein